MSSRVTPIAELPELSGEDLAALKEYDKWYDNLTPDDRPYGDSDLDLTLDATTLTDRQKTIIRSRYQTFLEIVRQDAAANGMPGNEGLFTLSVGKFEAADDGIDWHADITDRPTLRYVASFGEMEPPLFALGDVRLSDVDAHPYTDRQIDVEGGDFEVVRHPTATVLRFLANQGVHRSPPGDGYRLFFSIDIEVPPTEHDTAVPHPITQAEVQEQFRRWEYKEPVASQAVAVTTLPVLSDTDLAALREITSPYQSLRVDDLRPDTQPALRGLDVHGITPAQAAIVVKAFEEFLDAARRDAQTNGLYHGPANESLPTISIGQFDHDTNNTGWHIDDTDEPRLRYVASFGGSSTKFALGTVAPDEYGVETLFSSDEIEGNDDFDIIAHGPGVLSRFYANQTIHSSPPESGFRILFSVDIAVPLPDDYEHAEP